MPQESSERACDKCRERRVKCDKRQPTCRRCEQLGTSCPGYSKRRKFVDLSDRLRQKYETRPSSPTQSKDLTPVSRGKASWPSSTTPHTLSRQTWSANDRHANSSTHTSTWSRISSTQPPDFTNVNETSIHDQPSASTLEIPKRLLNGPKYIAAEQSSTVESLGESLGYDGDATLDDLWDGTTFDPEWFDLDPVEYYGNGNNSCGFIPQVPDIVDGLDQVDTGLNTDPSLSSPYSAGMETFTDSYAWATESQLHTAALLVDEREHEVAYLIRHFTEFIGPWMDLYDTDQHFTQLVPLKALRDGLLRNAIAAVAAKQLGCIGGVKSCIVRQTQRPSMMEVIEDVVGADWYYKAANYYDKAIAFSRQYLEAVSGRLSTPQSTTMKSLSASSADLLLGVSIFSLYESLDNLGVAWLQHLAGMKSLLACTNPEPELESRRSISAGRMASFWNFVRADYQAAYLHRQRTFLNTDDLALWHDCGLQVQADGALYTSADAVKSNTSAPCRVYIELVTHTLLWLVLRVMNHLAASSTSTLHDDCDASPAQRFARWEQLSAQLDAWYATLPPIFQPVASMRRPVPARAAAAGVPSAGGRDLQPRSHSTGLTETFFSIDACAAGLQLYHFARILLLLHRPPDAPGRSRLQAYREVSAAAIRHAHAIVGIALARPRPAIRVEMLLPLSVAGLCLEADDERALVLDLLRAIEKDTGYTTDARCRELVQGWGWEAEADGMLE